MQHPNDDVLIEIALSHGNHPDAAHLDTCAECRRAVDEFVRAIDATAFGPDRLEPPSEAVWRRVLAEIDAPVELRTRSQGSAELQPTAPAAPKRRNRRRALLAVAAALLIGAGIGRLTAGVSDEPTVATTTLARTPLSTLGDAPEELGEADLTRSGSTTQVRIAMNSLPSKGQIVEAWLINKDGRRMISIGFVHGTEPQQFVIDPRLLDEGYVIVDVSREPLDGNPKHSGDSIVRGTLPV